MTSTDAHQRLGFERPVSGGKAIKDWGIASDMGYHRAGMYKGRVRVG